MTNNPSPIHKAMPIAEILEQVPECVDLLLETGLHCVGCGANSVETLEQGMFGHGFSPETIDEIVSSINQLRASRQKKSQVVASLDEKKLAELVTEGGEKYYLLAGMKWTGRVFDTLHQLATAPGLRLHVAAGGCSGYTYDYDYASAPLGEDQVFHFSDKLALYIDPYSQEKFAGSVVDYQIGLKGAGLTFDNPNVRRSCHCGTSVKF